MSQPSQRKCKECGECKPHRNFVHWKLLGDGVPAEQDNDNRYTNVCELCYPEVKREMARKMEAGKQKKKAAALANLEATRAASESNGENGAGMRPKTNNSIMLPSTAMEQCAAAALKQVQATASNIRLTYRGVPSYLGAAVLVWNQTSDQM
jgi:hypothetical protein